jgi:hypothetical protein
MRAITSKNASCVLALLLLYSATAWAQTTTTIATNQAYGFTVNLPAGCLTAASETVSFSGNTRTLWTYKTNKTTGNRTGSFSYAIPSWQGVGATSGATYVATGADDQEFANQDSFGDGHFAIYINMRISRVGTAGNPSFHYRQNFTITNQGNTLYLPPATIVCK